MLPAETNFKISVSGAHDDGDCADLIIDFARVVVLFYSSGNTILQVQKIDICSWLVVCLTTTTIITLWLDCGVMVTHPQPCFHYTYLHVGCRSKFNWIDNISLLVPVITPGVTSYRVLRLC